MTNEEFFEECKKIPTKKKRRMLCNELWKAKKRKEYFKLMFASDEEVEDVFKQTYDYFSEQVVLEDDYEQW